MENLQHASMELPLNRTNRELRSDNGPFNKHKIINTLLAELSMGKEEKTLVFGAINEVIAAETIKVLDDDLEGVSTRISYDASLEQLKIVIRPTKVHESHVPWLTEQLGILCTTLTLEEKLLLLVLPSPRICSFLPPFNRSKKEPDACVLPEGMTYPTLIVEAGWLETRPQLYHDRDVWLKGANGTTEAVLVVKWSRISANRVKGDIELWELDSVNNPALLQHEEIFPSPPAGIASTQAIYINKKQLFGSVLNASQSPTDQVPLYLDRFRHHAGNYIRQEGFTPV